MSAKKVKCDRSYPCSGCKKAGVECVNRAPAPPRRRKRKFPEQDLLSKVKKYEAMLRDNGIKLESSDGETDNNGDDARMNGQAAGGVQARLKSSARRCDDRQISNTF